MRLWKSFTCLVFLVPSCASAWCGERAESPSLSEIEVTAEDREHWSFRPLAVPNVPVCAAPTSGPIDCFVLSELEKKSLSFAPMADRATLLRRLKLDLLGLPPTVEELTDFLNDPRDEAYELMVDRWLASPQFAERQSQFWLDIARFAETDGFEHDKLRDEAWQYRDWVVDALNQDMAYDQFVTLQLVGDLEPTQEHRIATMFCLAGADMPDLNEQHVRRHDRLNELTSTVGSALLGLQMHCAQCHDHKYDPISQADFYRLRAVFEGAVPELKRDVPFSLFDGTNANTEAYFFLRGDVNYPGASVAPAFPRIACAEGNAECDPQQPRRALAKWLFESNNPLPSRVIVNRIWQHHFGRGLFENPSDVGVVAGGPSHPELLEWLANFLRQQHWSLKALHREIVLSMTYCQSSRAVDESQRASWLARLQVDPQNEAYSRFSRKRLEGEAIRDCLLEVAGQLNYHAGGPSVRPPLPAELVGTLLKNQWQPSSKVEDHHRRSIYVFARRNLRFPIFDVFDRPDAGASCPQRNRSTTAIQSLQMFNSELSQTCASALCERINAFAASGHYSEDYPRWIDQLFKIVLSRPATDAELKLFADFAKEESSRNSACLAILNSNEFLYVD